jgi:hypothetical protein
VHQKVGVRKILFRLLALIFLLVFLGGSTPLARSLGPWTVKVEIGSFSYEASTGTADRDSNRLLFGM